MKSDENCIVDVGFILIIDLSKKPTVEHTFFSSYEREGSVDTEIASWKRKKSDRNRKQRHVRDR